MKKRGILLVGNYTEFVKEFKMVSSFFGKLNIEMEAVDFKDIQVSAEGDWDGTIYVKEQKQKAPDVVFVMTVRERQNYQLKAVLRMFEELNIPCINKFDAIERVEDKLYSFQIASHFVPEIKIPKTILLNENSTPESIIERVGLPLVLKIMHGNEGRGVTLVESKKELKNMLSMLFGAEPNDEIIAQEAIMSSAGRDMRIIICNGAYVHSFVRHNDGEFKSNLYQGGSIEDYVPSEQLIEYSVRLANAYGLKLCSIDYLFGEDEDTFYLCEANSIPGISYLFKAQKEGDYGVINRFLDNIRKMLIDEGINIDEI